MVSPMLVSLPCCPFFFCTWYFFVFFFFRRFEVSVRPSPPVLHHCFFFANPIPPFSNSLVSTQVPSPPQNSGLPVVNRQDWPVHPPTFFLSGVLFAVQFFPLITQTHFTNQSFFWYHSGHPSFTFLSFSGLPGPSPSWNIVLNPARFTLVIPLLGFEALSLTSQALPVKY